jgi:hypothetical protein
MCRGKILDIETIIEAILHLDVRSAVNSDPLEGHLRL